MAARGPDSNRSGAYVIVTPARNEAAFIEQTIQSVICQTVPPLKWVIVSDGSTDATEAIVEKHAAIHKWIVLLRMPKREERNFAGKVQRVQRRLRSGSPLTIQISDLHGCGHRVRTGLFCVSS